MLLLVLLTLGHFGYALTVPEQGPLPPTVYKHLARAEEGECTEDPQGSEVKTMVYTCEDDGVKITRYAAPNCGGSEKDAQILNCNMEGCTAAEHDYHITGLMAACVDKEEMEKIGVDTADIDFTSRQVLIYTHKGFTKDLPGMKKCPPEVCTMVHAQGHDLMIPVPHERAPHKLFQMLQAQSRVYAEQSVGGGDEGKSWEELKAMTKEMGEEARANLPRRRMKEADMWAQGLTPTALAMRNAATWQDRERRRRLRRDDGPDDMDEPISEDVGSCSGEKVWHLATELAVSLARLHPVVIFFEVGISVVKEEGCNLADKYCKNPWLACWYGPLACVLSYASCAVEAYVCPETPEEDDFGDLMKKIAKVAKDTVMERLAQPIEIVDSFLTECVDFDSRYWQGIGMEIFCAANLFLVEGGLTFGAGIDAKGKYAIYADASGNVAGITDIVDFSSDKLNNFEWSVEAGVNVILHLRRTGDIGGWGIGHSISKTMNVPCIPAACVATVSLDAGMACTDWQDTVAGFLGGVAGNFGFFFNLGEWTWDAAEEALMDPSGKCKLNQISTGVSGGLGGTLSPGPPAYSLSGGYTYTFHESDLKKDWRAMRNFMDEHVKLEQLDLETLAKTPCEDREKTIGSFSCGEAEHCGPNNYFDYVVGECWDGYYSFEGDCLRCEINNYDLEKEERRCRNVEWSGKVDDVTFCAQEAIKRLKTSFSFEAMARYGYTGKQMCYVPDEEEELCRTTNDGSTHTYKAVYPEYKLTNDWDDDCDQWCEERGCPDWYEAIDYRTQPRFITSHCREATRTLGLQWFDTSFVDDLLCVYSYSDEDVRLIEKGDYSDYYKKVCRKQQWFRDENMADMEQNLHFDPQSEDNIWYPDDTAVGESVFAAQDTEATDVNAAEQGVVYGLAGLGVLAVTALGYKQLKKIFESEYKPLVQ